MKEKKWYGFDGFKHEIQKIDISMQIVTCVNGIKCLLFAIVPTIDYCSVFDTNLYVATTATLDETNLDHHDSER